MTAANHPPSHGTQRNGVMEWWATSGSEPILLKSIRCDRPAQRIGLHVAVGHLPRLVLAPAPPMPPAGPEEVVPLNHLKLELPFSPAFRAALQLGNIFVHGRNIAVRRRRRS